MARGALETEIKLALPDLKTARRLLRAAGFRLWKRRVFEDNTLYDTPDLALRAAGKLLRVRQAGGTAIVTYKGTPLVSRHKSREELEAAVSDAGTVGAIFGRLGMQRVFRYEKYRTEYRQPAHSGVAMLDETPLGLFVELEGAPRWIDRTARQLGFSPAAYITASYARLYFEWCERNGVPPSDMVFPRS